MHVSDHSRVASLLFFCGEPALLLQSYPFFTGLSVPVHASYCGRTEILQVRVVLCCPFDLRPSRHVILPAVMGCWSTRREGAGSRVTRPNEMANLDNGFAATRARMLENALND